MFLYTYISPRPPLPPKIDSQSSKGLCAVSGAGIQFPPIRETCKFTDSKQRLCTFGGQDPMFHFYRTNDIVQYFKGFLCTFGDRDAFFTYTKEGRISCFKRFLCTFGPRDPCSTYTKNVFQISKGLCPVSGPGIHFPLLPKVQPRNSRAYLHLRGQYPFITHTEIYNLIFQRVSVHLRDWDSFSVHERK